MDTGQTLASIPAAFFIHFPPQYHRGQAAIDKHLEYFRATDMDIVKIQYEFPFPKIPAIQTPADWANMPSYRREYFQDQLDVTAGLVNAAKGEALVSKEPIGFYGGIDAKTGVVIEKEHELEGQCVKDRVLVFPCGKGSTVGSYVIYGLAKNGVGPAALVNKETETIVATGAILAGIPTVDGIDIDEIATGDILVIDAEAGTVEKAD